MITVNLRKVRPYILNARILDVLIIVVGVMAAWHYYQSPPRRKPEVQLPWIEVNKVLSLPGIDWNQAPRNVVLAMTLSCQYCVTSAELYKRLSELVSSRSGFRFVVVAPEDTSSLQKWMTANSIVNYTHVRENFHLRGFRYSPTIALVDQAGTITDLIVGKVSADGERLLFDRLSGRGGQLKIGLPGLVPRVSPATTSQ